MSDEELKVEHASRVAALEEDLETLEQKFEFLERHVTDAAENMNRAVRTIDSHERRLLEVEIKTQNLSHTPGRKNCIYDLCGAQIISTSGTCPKCGRDQTQR